MHAPVAPWAPHIRSLAAAIIGYCLLGCMCFEGRIGKSERSNFRAPLSGRVLDEDKRKRSQHALLHLHFAKSHDLTGDTAQLGNRAARALQIRSPSMVGRGRGLVMTKPNTS